MIERKILREPESEREEERMRPREREGKYEER